MVIGGGGVPSLSFMHVHRAWPIAPFFLSLYTLQLALKYLSSSSAVHRIFVQNDSGNGHAQLKIIDSNWKVSVYIVRAVVLGV